MRRLSPALALVIGLLLAIAFAGVATAAVSKFRSFGPGDVTLTRTGARLVNDSGEYSGIYLRSRGSAKSVKSVHMSFDYTGSVAGGAPRFSIPLDIDRDRTVDGYAFLDALNCGDTGSVSTDDDDCKVFLNFSSEWFVNWDALVAAHPSWRIPPRSIPFVIADQPGDYRVSNVDLR